jgi:hypothetical protein
MRIEESTLVVHLEPNAADESQPAMQNMLKHVGEGGARSIRFNGFPLAAIEFIRWAGEGAET